MTDQIFTAAEGLGVDIFTTEAKILAYLGRNGEARVKEVMLETTASYRGFYLALDRLKLAKLVSSKVCEIDKRVRFLQLNIDARSAA